MRNLHAASGRSAPNIRGFRILVLCLVAFALSGGFLAARSQDTTSAGAFPAAADSLLKVDTVVIVGNKHTKDFVILREMTLKPGIAITQQRLEYDQNRIYSLRLFNEVRIRVMPTNPGFATLIIEVSERWYIFPFPILGIRDRDWSKVYYGLGILHSNFRGRNEKLYTTLVLGFDPSVNLSYRTPFITESGTSSLDLRFAYNKVQNRSLLAEVGTTSDFDEQHFSFFTTFGRRLGIEHTFWLTGGYEFVSVPDTLPGRTISPGNRDSYAIVGIGYAYDTRDLDEYPGMGSYASATVTKFGLNRSSLNIVRYAADLRHYQPIIPRVVFANRVFTNLVAAGPTPSYNRVYFGYGERIRGHFKEVMEGEDIIGVTSELHVVLLPIRYFTVKFLPAEFSVWQFGLVAALFADAGEAWFRGSPVALNDFARGYGFGLHILLPYSAVLRTEVAWNEVRRSEFIIDIGRAF